MKLGLGVGRPAREVQIDIELVRHAESLGYDSVWTAEAWGNDAITPLAWIAAQTTKIRLGTAIMQMAARTPAMCAMQAMTVDQLSGGRLIVGLGPSGPQVVEGWHGVPYGKPLEQTREYVAILRAIFRREAPLEFEGARYQIPYRGSGASGLGKPLRSMLHGRADIPIFTATLAPRGIETAAEIADGFIPILTAPEGVSSFRGPIDAGLARAGGGKTLAHFEIMPQVHVVVDDDLDRARRSLKTAIALYAGGMGARGKNFYKDHLARQGWEDAVEKVQDLFLDGRRDEAAAAVPDALVDAVALVGPKERIRDRVAAWKASGVPGLYLLTDRAGVDVMAELCL